MGINQVLIDLAGMLEGFADGALRDFVESHALDAWGVAILILILIFILIFILTSGKVSFAKKVGEVGEVGEVAY